ELPKTYVQRTTEANHRFAQNYTDVFNDTNDTRFHFCISLICENLRQSVDKLLFDPGLLRRSDSEFDPIPELPSRHAGNARGETLFICVRSRSFADHIIVNKLISYVIVI